MKFLRQLFLILIYLLPATLFFSYHPLIYLGSNSTMNFELSLPLIWLALFCPVSLILFIGGNIKWANNHDVSQRWRFFSRGSGATARTSAPAPQRRALATRLEKRYRYPWLALAFLFPLYATASMFWSPNPLRAFLTSSILWLIIFSIVAFFILLPRLAPASFRATWLKIFFISTAVVCLFCWLQSILDLVGCPRETTLLCPGCTSQTFGFPHPSGFAIEPQFMGNLLLAPTLTALYLLTFKKCGGEKKSRNRHTLILLAFIFSATLFLTLSRGAIYAYACALFALLILALKSRANWRALVLIPLFSFIFTLSAQGIFSALGPTSDNFISGTSKVIHQLSLGIIDIRPEYVKGGSAPSEDVSARPSEPASESPTVQPADVSQPADALPSSRFDGYIAASTNERFGLNSLALQTWRRDLPTILFGVGLGGAGLAITATVPGAPLSAPNAIIQNQFLSLLLELGLLGYALLILGAVAIIVCIKQSSAVTLLGRSEVATEQRQGIALMIPLALAYALTLNFFSGLPNALQIYLLPPLLFVIFCANFRKNSCAPQK